MEPLETTRKKKKSGRGKPIKLRQRSSATPRSGTFAVKKMADLQGFDPPSHFVLWRTSRGRSPTSRSKRSLIFCVDYERCVRLKTKKWQTCKDSTEAQRADVREHRRPQVEKRKATSR